MRPCRAAASIRRSADGQIVRDRLFHQHVDAGFQQCAADLGVGDRGRGDDGGVDLAGELAHVGERSALGSARRPRGARRVGIDHGRQFAPCDSGRRGSGSAEGSSADDGDSSSY